MEAGAQTYSQTLGEAWGTQQKTRGRIVGMRGFKDTTRTLSTTPTREGTKGFTEIETATAEPAWVCIRSSAHMLWLFSLGFCGTCNSGSVGGGSLILLPALETLILLLGCLI